MKKKVIFSIMFAFAIFEGQAQENKAKESNVEIKIVTVDENGNKEVVVKEFSDFDIDDMDNLHQVHLTDADIEIIKGEDGQKVFVRQQMKSEKSPFLGIHLANAEGGILITEVVKGSGAENAGLQKGDILTSFNKVSITSSDDLKLALETLEVGDKVKLEYLREGILKKTSAELGEFPKSTFEKKMIWVKDGDEMIFSNEENSDVTFDTEVLKTKPFLGIKPVENAQDITGVMIFEVIEGTSAEKLNLQTGDVIYEINGQNIEDFDDLVLVLKNMNPNDAIEVKYKRDGNKKITSGNLGSKADGNNSMKFIIKDYPIDPDGVVEVETIVNKISDEEKNMLSRSSGEDLENRKELDNVDLEIYPNPSSGKFNLNLVSNEKGAVSIKLFNSEGTEVYSKTINEFMREYSTEIETLSNAKGTYFLIISQNNKILTEKIIMQ